MIISHEHKFIFLHCRKVAGSSIKTSLYPFLGQDDVMIGSLHEAIESGAKINRAALKKMASLRGSGAFLKTLVSGNGVSKAVNQAIKAFYRGSLSLNPPHATAKEIRDYFGENCWNEYFKFCFVRNPYEQVISDFFWRRKVTNRNFSFDEFINSLSSGDDLDILGSGLIRNWEIYTIDDAVAVDYVGRYENLQSDFSHVLDRIGIGNIQLSRQKRRPKGESSSFALNSSQVSLIESIYKNEIEEFDYKYSPKDVV